MIKAKRQGASMKPFDTSNTMEENELYAINTMLHTMIWASRKNNRHMFTKAPTSDVKSCLVCDWPIIFNVE